MCVVVVYFIQSIKYNIILFYIIYKTERLKRYRLKKKMRIYSIAKLISNKSENVCKIKKK